MSRSIISNERQCLICHTTIGLHKHHIYGGFGNRKLSERYGCWCYLCGRHHNLSNEGVHFNKKFDDSLKRYCQKRWEELNGTTEDFIRVFGRSWL